MAQKGSSTNSVVTLALIVCLYAIVFTVIADVEKSKAIIYEDNAKAITLMRQMEKNSLVKLRNVKCRFSIGSENEAQEKIKELRSEGYSVIAFASFDLPEADQQYKVK